MTASFIVFLVPGIASAADCTGWPAGSCGCLWKGEVKPIEYEYRLASESDKTALDAEFKKSSDAGLSPAPWECAKGSYGAPSDKYCCARQETTGTIVDHSSSASAAPAQSAPGGLVLVGCAAPGGTGDCTISDVVQQAVNFASFIMGLAGSLFLVIFIYGGALYLASFGTPKYAQKGKDAMVKSTIGIVLVLGAWTIVSYVATSIGYNRGGGLGGAASGGSDEQCAKKHPGHSCMMVTPAQEKNEYICYSKLCLSNSDKQYKCCVQAPTNK